MTADEAMTIALEQARLALEHGDVPIGAVVLVDGEPIAVAHNRREVDRDPSAHAEVLALRAAGQAVGIAKLARAVLVVTLEPCVMCAGAARAAHVARVVFGAVDPKAGACGSRYNLLADVRLGGAIAVESGPGAPASASLLRAFFAPRRQGS